MKLVVPAVLLSTLAVARAETSFLEDNPANPPVPAAQLFEAACDLDVELRGALAQVEVRQRIVNPGPDAMAATYAFDLPRGATITGFSFRGDGAVERALAIPGTFTTVDGATRSMLGADPALLVAQGPDALAQYLVRLQPIEADHEVTITTRYSMIGELRAGAIRVVIPGRASNGKLTACRGTVRASVGPGATVQGFRIGKATTTRPTATFVVDTQDVAIDANLVIAGREPVVWTQTQPLVEGWSATLVTVAAPPLKTTTPQARRALFVIDGSRSMELVGRQNVSKVIERIANALPANVEVEGILYDRAAARVFNTWKPESAAVIAELQAAVVRHVPQNGSSITDAFALAHTAITDGARAQTMVIVISDGVLGDLSGQELTRTLDLTTSAVDVLAVVLDPGRTRSPDAAVLRSPVNLFGGSFVELPVDELDDALLVVDDWLRPSWLELAMGDLAIPASVPAGGGFTRTVIHQGSMPRLALTGHGDRTIKVMPRTGPTAPIATVALAAQDPDDDALELAGTLRGKALAAFPYARPGLAYAVLTTRGKVARSRIAMVKGGGPYERITAVADPLEQTGAGVVAATTATGPSAISKLTLERLFRDQLQPKAFACYQRALGTNPKFSGTAVFELRLGRGEITQVTLTGIAGSAFEDCLKDAAYSLSVPFPDFAVNADDQTIAHYPLTFNVSEAKPVIVLGDADSSSPIDIDAVQGGVPIKVRGGIQPNSATPLGNLRPSKQP